MAIEQSLNYFIDHFDDLTKIPPEFTATIIPYLRNIEASKNQTKEILRKCKSIFDRWESSDADISTLLLTRCLEIWSCIKGEEYFLENEPLTNLIIEEVDAGNYTQKFRTKYSDSGSALDNLILEEVEVRDFL
ncbi:hypothetical protein KAFR_0H03040 [Kazachstania africana CBS 2517]|uniref:Nucleolar protein SWM2 n=1 Tax=Kazachstania africana (strain ATCC 22294 / BCRC 22015 / CBS 2517 / CECT 1963 / NBRC 1671 / NRRL Y-8276) TaxID=1071382 RepID=H2AZF8_KAZAF|nr:hypothetical protein KAFR_0H03040 [Kazachstania africana CBS 2517]CCF59714.1 hypothetical protein KAFR_0H03040 [Kazachstania africana CBS 2517]